MTPFDVFLYALAVVAAIYLAPWALAAVVALFVAMVAVVCVTVIYLIEALTSFCDKLKRRKK